MYHAFMRMRIRVRRGRSWEGPAPADAPSTHERPMLGRILRSLVRLHLASRHSARPE